MRIPHFARFGAAALSLGLCLPAAQAQMSAQTAQSAPMGAEAAFHVPAGVYLNDKNHSNVLWSVTHFGLSHYYGRFDGIDAKLTLDAQDITRSKLHVEIDPNSVDTNHTTKPNMFNAKIAGPKILDAAQFPIIRFDADKITITGAKTAEMAGQMTLHGVTRPVTMAVTFNNSMNPQPKMQAAAVGFSASFSFKRSDFGLTMLMPRVSDEVQVTVETEFYNQAEYDAAQKAAAEKETAPKDTAQKSVHKG